LEISLLLHIAWDIAKGLEFLHHIGLIHRDLKSSNVLLSFSRSNNDMGNGNMENNGYNGAKICDFGTARALDNESKSKKLMTGNLGTCAWMAPELFEKNSDYGTAVDVYAYGMVLWELTHRKIPFEEEQMFTVPQKVMKGDRPPIGKNTPKALKKLITSCWHGKAAKRPTMSTVTKAIAQLYEESLAQSGAAGGGLLRRESLKNFKDNDFLYHAAYDLMDLSDNDYDSDLSSLDGEKLERFSFSDNLSNASHDSPRIYEDVPGNVLSKGASTSASVSTSPKLANKNKNKNLLENSMEPGQSLFASIEGKGAKCKNAFTLFCNRLDKYTKKQNWTTVSELRKAQFFCANSYNEKNSFTMAVKYIRWMLKHSVKNDCVYIGECTQVFHDNILAVPGIRDNMGRQVVYMKPNKYFPAKMHYSVLLKGLVYTLERLIEDDQVLIEGYTFMCDMRGWNWSNFSRPYAQRFFNMVQFIFPAQIKRFILVDPPSFFNVVWATIRPMMSKEFARMWSFTKRPELKKIFVDASNIPQDMDGSCRYVGSDFVNMRKESGEPSMMNVYGHIIN